MNSGYNSKSCNALQRPFYRPVEAAIRWCGLIDHEPQILAALDQANPFPMTGQFPLWPCLQSNTEKILDAVLHGDMPHGRDGQTVDDQVARHRLTVRHTDLKAWMSKHYPDQKPPFLFDETERATHAAINADSFRALQADRDALKAELEKVKLRESRIASEHDALRGERDSLKAMVDRMAAPGERAETTYQNIIGGLLGIMLGKTPGGVPQSAYTSQNAIKEAFLAHYPGMVGERTLDEKFAAANKSVQQSKTT